MISRHASATPSENAAKTTNGSALPEMMPSHAQAAGGYRAVRPAPMADATLPKAASLAAGSLAVPALKESA